MQTVYQSVHDGEHLYVSSEDEEMQSIMIINSNDN